jgi:hypothetical protein
MKIYERKGRKASIYRWQLFKNLAWVTASRNKFKKQLRFSIQTYLPIGQFGGSYKKRVIPSEDSLTSQINKLR